MPPIGDKLGGNRKSLGYLAEDLGGDVVGPAAVVDGTAALWDGITGKLLKDSRMKVIGGAVCLPLLNRTGVLSVIGDIVSIDLANDLAFVLTTGFADQRFAGVVMEAVASLSLCYLAVIGHVLINCDATAIARGDFLDPSATPGKAHPHAGTTPTTMAVAASVKGAGVGTVQGWLKMEMF